MYMARVAAIAMAFGLGSLLVLPSAPGTLSRAWGQEAVDPTVVVFDASTGMTDTDEEGTTRLDTAKAAMYEFLERAPQQVPLGLITYGAAETSPAGDAQCHDVAVLSQPAEQNRAALKTQIAALQASGDTPLGNALLQAHEILPREGSKSIILVAHRADSCAPPPVCDVAEHLKEQSTDIAIHTIGFMVDDSARQELTCIAQATGGTYSEASTKESLQTGLLQAMTRSVEERYHFPSKVVQFGKNLAEAPEVPLGSLEHPTRITARTLTEDQEEDGRNLVKLRIPKGHRIQIGFMAVPKITAGTTERADTGRFAFAPQLEHEADGMMITCESNFGSGSGNLLDTDAPTSGYLVGDIYDDDSPCYDSEVYLDIGMIRSTEFQDSVDLDMTLTAVAEPDELGDEENSEPAAERDAAELETLSSTADVVAVKPSTQPEGAEELIGTTYSEIAEGDTHYFAVPVAWGQSLSGTLEILDNQSDIQPTDSQLDDNQISEQSQVLDQSLTPDQSIEIQAINEIGQTQELIGATEIDVATIAGPANFGTRFPVSYANVDSQDHHARAFWLGGTQYVAVSFTETQRVATAEEPDNPAQLKYRLTLRPQGEELSGPVFVTAAATEDETAGQQTAEASATAMPESPRTTPVARTLKIAGGSIAALAVVITFVIVMVKTRK